LDEKTQDGTIHSTAISVWAYITMPTFHPWLWQGAAYIPFSVVAFQVECKCINSATFTPQRSGGWLSMM